MKKTILKETITKNFTYTLTSKKITAEEYGTVTVYGIGIRGRDSSACIDDISSSRSTVTRLYELICEGELYPEHLYDVAEDMLS